MNLVIIMPDTNKYNRSVLLAAASEVTTRSNVLKKERGKIPFCERKKKNAISFYFVATMTNETN